MQVCTCLVLCTDYLQLMPAETHQSEVYMRQKTLVIFGVALKWNGLEWRWRVQQDRLAAVHSRHVSCLPWYLDMWFSLVVPSELLQVDLFGCASLLRVSSHMIPGIPLSASCASSGRSSKMMQSHVFFSEENLCEAPPIMRPAGKVLLHPLYRGIPLAFMSPCLIFMLTRCEIQSGYR